MIPSPQVIVHLQIVVTAGIVVTTGTLVFVLFRDMRRALSAAYQLDQLDRVRSTATTRRPPVFLPCRCGRSWLAVGYRCSICGVVASSRRVDAYRAGLALPAEPPTQLQRGIPRGYRLARHLPGRLWDWWLQRHL